jgi:hypothetical protein
MPDLLQGVRVMNLFKLSAAVIAFIALLPGLVGCSSNSTPSASNIITKDASQFVLTIDNFPPGWTRDSAEAATKAGAQSAYESYFYKLSAYLSVSVVQDVVAVYPSIASAHQVYLGEKPQDVSLEYPKIGDECFLNSAIPIDQLLVFRKDNVVVWVWLQQDYVDDIKPYAVAIQKKIY